MMSLLFLLVCAGVSLVVSQAPTEQSVLQKLMGQRYSASRMNGIRRGGDGSVSILFNDGVMVADGEIPHELCMAFPNLTSFTYYVGSFRGDLDAFQHCSKLTHLDLSPNKFVSDVRELNSTPPRFLPTSLSHLEIEDANIDFVKYGIPTECKLFRVILTIQ